MLTGVVVYPLAAAIAAVVAWRAVRGGLPAFVVAMRVLFVLYLGWVAGATLFPLPVRPGVAELEAAGRGVTVGLAPLASIRDVLLHGSRFAQAWILGGNVLTLAPFGFLLPFSAPRLGTLTRMALAGLLFSLSIELEPARRFAGARLLVSGDRGRRRAAERPGRPARVRGVRRAGGPGGDAFDECGVPERGLSGLIGLPAGAAAARAGDGAVLRVH